MLRVTADTNIFISALNFRGGKPFQFLELARAGRISLTVSNPILDDVADVLARKFDFTAEDVANARYHIRAMARTVIPSVHLYPSEQPLLTKFNGSSTATQSPAHWSEFLDLAESSVFQPR